MRIAIFGDVQGWSLRLVQALVALGANPDAGTLPDDLVVVQVGDLVHKGPDSLGAIALVDRFLAASPGRWIQLIGNHEAQYLGGPSFWPHEIPSRLQNDLRRWVRDGDARLALAIETAELGEVLVTHAGLTRWKWTDLGRPASAAEAARLLNADLHSDPETAFAAGVMQLRGIHRNVGVVWAEPVSELVMSWDVGDSLPFSQVHGHASAYDWDRGGWRQDASNRVVAHARADQVTRHVTFAWSGGGSIIGIDPGFGRHSADVALVPLVLDGEVLG